MGRYLGKIQFKSVFIGGLFLIENLIFCHSVLATVARPFEGASMSTLPQELLAKIFTFFLEKSDGQQPERIDSQTRKDFSSFSRVGTIYREAAKECLRSHNDLICAIDIKSMAQKYQWDECDAGYELSCFEKKLCDKNMLAGQFTSFHFIGVTPRIILKIVDSVQTARLADQLSLHAIEITHPLIPKSFQNFYDDDSDYSVEQTGGIDLGHMELSSLILDFPTSKINGECSTKLLDWRALEIFVRTGRLAWVKKLFSLWDPRKGPVNHYLRGDPLDAYELIGVLQEACEGGYLEIVQFLTTPSDENWCPVKANDFKGDCCCSCSPFMLAVKAGHAKICRWLMSCAPDPVKSTDNMFKEWDEADWQRPQLPVHIAAFEGNLEVCKILLAPSVFNAVPFSSKQFASNFGRARPDWHGSALTRAVKGGQLEVCKFLMTRSEENLEPLDPRCQDQGNYGNALMAAVAGGHGTL